MPKTTVLFVCPDNSLLGPMAEACLNARGSGLMRAFSAGLQPAAQISKNVSRLLSAHGVSAQGLSPKSIEVFLMPHAIVPDRIIYLSDVNAILQPSSWKGTTSSHWWSVTDGGALSDDFAACSAYLKRIWQAIDGLIDPSVPSELSTGYKVA
ncbi:arsenate-mycothiol transferase ArsC [Roseibium alexandrii]|uniref:Protein-tyrosine-phosphatase n=1 Tax=Roseibium alexandrii TaxID=388408 RepID=A0A0M7AAA4_9HYPH|nr:hypothetical protein [Roseibium alexandrii]CTQ71551.1 Protein-tyrosine-phosphatase [Roseibium alexandrii]